MRRGLIVGGCVLLLVLTAAVLRDLEFRGDAKPGVHVFGLDVSGQSRSKLERTLKAWEQQPVTIRAPGRSYHVQRAWLLALDVPRTASRVLNAGSLTSLVHPRRVDVTPVITPSKDAGGVLAALAQLDRPAVSATVSLQGLSIVTTHARIGRTLDRTTLLRKLVRGETSFAAPYLRIRPARRDPAARSAASTARLLIARPLALGFHGARLGALRQIQLARALRINARTHTFAVRFDGETLAKVVRPRMGKWIKRAHNAQFAVKGNRVHVVPARPGHDLDPTQVAIAVTAAAHSAGAVSLELGDRQPDLTTAKADALGIRKKLVSFTTEMGESSSNRIHNVHLMADFIDGTVIEPGAVFSYNKVVGPRTAERGFLEGQEIIGSLVLPSIGGGVCQTATTLFNDAFELGLPILARTNHNLYLSHYPLGRDATVSWGGPDFEFRNDLKHGLLIKTSYTDQTLTFTFYGTSEGRRVVSHTGPKTHWSSPGMNYAVDLSAPRNSKRVVRGTGELGFDVNVTRIVYSRSGKVIRRNTFKSHYIPDSSTTVYGPGQKPPGPYIVIPTST